MWASRFWADSYWAPRYWAKVGGEAPAPTADDVGAVYYYTRRRGGKKRRYKEHIPENRRDELRDLLQRIWAEAKGERLPEAASEQIAVAIRPFVEERQQIDWSRLLESLDAIDRIIRAYVAVKELEQEDEDAVAIFLAGREL